MTNFRIDTKNSNGKTTTTRDSNTLDLDLLSVKVGVDALSISQTGSGAGASLDVNSRKISNVATPTSPQDASTKAYVDAALSGSTSGIWRNGTSAPSNGLGVDNDYFLNTSTRDVYLKTAGVYSLVAKVQSLTAIDVVEGGTGLTSVGTSLQVLRTNAAATGLEFASVSLGGGDVIGAVSSTDDDFVLFNGTTGKLIKVGFQAVPITKGGTGATSAAAARANLGVAGISRATFSATNYVVSPGETYIAQIGTIPASTGYTVTLPLANSVPGGYTITLIDESGTLAVVGSNNNNLLSFISQGGNTLYGIAGSSALREAYVPMVAISNGVDGWYCQSSSTLVYNEGQNLNALFFGTKKDIQAGFIHPAGTGAFVIRDTSEYNIIGNTEIQGTQGVFLPRGNTSARPTTPNNGILRYNTDTLLTEFYQNSNWYEIGGLPKVTVFTANGTFTKDVNSKHVYVQMLGGGGAGGSGRKGAAATVRSGGGGGSSGAYSERRYLVSVLSASESVVVSNGGVGGASQVTDSTNGVAGTVGGFSSFSSGNTLCVARGGLPGAGGTAVSAAGGAAVISLGSSAAGGASSATGAVGTVGGTSVNQCAGGGGAGGGITTANAASAGGAGGALPPMITTTNTGGGTGGTANNAGNIGTASATNTVMGGAGAGGGGASTTTNGGTGGSGGNYGSGGGGGGSAVNAVGNSGAGGNGGFGIVVVFEW